MITTADIGVGISGLEGQQAARASDYAIGQFKFLKTLLLVHGRECNRRNAYVVGYMFYKNMLFVLCIFWFGIVSAFSGLTIYEQWLYLFYNVVFTAFPIMWFAVFDYEYPKKELAQDPKYYIYIVKKSLSLGKFFRWIFFALWQSMLFCVLAFFPFEQQGGSFWMEGNFVYLGVVMIVNIKILTDTNNHTIISVLLFLMSIFLFLAGTVAINFLTMSDLYGVLENTLTSLELYLILILFMLAVAQIDIGLNYINRLIRLRFIIFVQKVQTRFNRRKTFDHQNLQNSKKIHTGFAFSQEPGNAPQVVERVKKNSIKLNPFVNPKSVGYCDFQGEF